MPRSSLLESAGLVAHPVTSSPMWASDQGCSQPDDTETTAQVIFETRLTVRIRDGNRGKARLRMSELWPALPRQISDVFRLRLTHGTERCRR